ncbi:hypothetical protein CCACVL1_08959 [Corchorus capsularis]|uniref:Cyclin-like domain-containing protein n=1 Tax=Corchorus capsularis TaxID=210143 RepID=A0A1R3IY83_COCAP|nr:hypothetical protein CCACVL1_08959 [Corchorus capsularis]
MDSRCAASVCLSEQPDSSTRKWYFSREEIENHSPSRKDGIDLGREEQLRKSYCSFIQELGMKLKVPQVGIACAMMLCHRFYMRQSHAKNDWKTTATACTFLASKIEETPRSLSDVIVVAYEIIYKRDPSAPGRIREREVYDKQKQLILTGERLLLATIAFDLEIQLPYKPLVAAMKKLEVGPNLLKVAWNFVNDWLRTTLCLRYKPHYIAAGSMRLAAKFQNVKLPMENGRVWWLEFDISPKQLQEVTQQMVKLLEQDKKRALPARHEKPSQSCTLDAPLAKDQSGAEAENGELRTSVNDCVRKVSLNEVFQHQTSDSGASSVVEDSNENNQKRTEVPGQNRSSKVVSSQAFGNKQVSLKENLTCQTSDSGASTVVDNGDGECERRIEESHVKPSFGIVSARNTLSKIDADRIRETLKRRRCDKAANSKRVRSIDDEADSEAWIERELESGIEMESSSSQKQRKVS